MLRRLCDELGAVLIFDEVISFRYGYHGAQGIYGGDPDLTTIAKIIGGGFSVGAIAGKAEVMAVFDHSHGKPLAPASGTFSANPVSMVAGKVSMDMLDPAAFAHLQALGRPCARCHRASDPRQRISGQVTGVGSNFVIHPHVRHITGYRSAWRAPDECERIKALQHGLLKQGVFMAVTGSGFISTATTTKDLDHFGGALAEVMADVTKRH